jgi:hypothetical protein
MDIINTKNSKGAKNMEQQPTNTSEEANSTALNEAMAYLAQNRDALQEVLDKINKDQESAAQTPLENPRGERMSGAEIHETPRQGNYFMDSQGGVHPTSESARQANEGYRDSQSR